jgi:hypothetical protein
MKYRKKPIVIEAMQLTPENAESIVDWIGESHAYSSEVETCYIEIDTLEGRMTAYKGDYVIKGIKGEFYPCKSDIFEASYEKVES